MEDEPPWSHAGRIARVNGWDRFPSLDYLADSADMTCADYLDAQSMAALLKFAKFEGSEYFYGSPFGALHLRFTRHGFDSGPRRCEQCGENQEALIGFQWFRRLHNLAGIDWCLIHGSRLAEVPKPLLVSFRTNVKRWQLLRNTVPVTAESEELVHASEFTQRYAAALGWMCEPSRSIPRERVLNSLERQCDSGNVRDLFAVVVSTAEPTWLSRHFASSQSLLNLRKALDGIHTGPQLAYFWALAWAAAFPDAQTALAELARLEVVG